MRSNENPGDSRVRWSRARSLDGKEVTPHKTVLTLSLGCLIAPLEKLMLLPFSSLQCHRNQHPMTSRQSVLSQNPCYAGPEIGKIL